MILLTISSSLLQVRFRLCISSSISLRSNSTLRPILIDGTFPKLASSYNDFTGKLMYSETSFMFTYRLFVMFFIYNRYKPKQGGEVYLLRKLFIIPSSWGLLLLRCTTVPSHYLITQDNQLFVIVTVTQFLCAKYDH
jgi:hypothetical protein